MKVKKTGAMFAKALLLTSSLFVVNNMGASNGIEQWANESFAGSDKSNFVWATIRNDTNESLNFKLEIPFVWDKMKRKKASHSVTIEPNKTVDIPVMYWGTYAGDTSKSMVILFSVGSDLVPQYFSFAEYTVDNNGQIIYGIRKKTIEVAPYYIEVTPFYKKLTSKKTQSVFFIIPEMKTNNERKRKIRSKITNIGLRTDYSFLTLSK